MSISRFDSSKNLASFADNKVRIAVEVWRPGRSNKEIELALATHFRVRWCPSAVQSFLASPQSWHRRRKTGCGLAEFTIPDSLKVPPLSDLGNVTEITQRFGGADPFRAAVAKLQELLYAA